MSGFDSKLDIKYKSKLFKPASSISFGQSGNPVIQIKNDQFCKPAKSTSLKVDNYYEEEEEEEYYVPQVKKPHTYLVKKNTDSEKTLALANICARAGHAQTPATGSEEDNTDCNKETLPNSI